MSKAPSLIRSHRSTFAAFVGLVLCATGVAFYILAHHDLALPRWVPVLGQDAVIVRAEVQTALAVVPGQGQSVTMAGVEIGRVRGVALRDGHGLLTLAIERRYFTLFRDASLLVRPRTLLKDMSLELDPGHPRAGRMPEGATIPLWATHPTVEPHDVLKSLDADSRAYLQVLLAGTGSGLRNQGARVREVLGAGARVMRSAGMIASAVRKRRVAVRNLVHRLRQITDAVAAYDGDLVRTVDRAQTVTATLADSRAQLRTTLAGLPRTVDRLRRTLRDAAPGVHALGPAVRTLLRSSGSAEAGVAQLGVTARATLSEVQNHIRPLARIAGQPLTALGRALAETGATSAPLSRAVGVVNRGLDAGARSAGAGQGSYLFWLSWLTHSLVSALGSQDANGPTLRGLLLADCGTLGLVPNLSRSNPALGTLIGLANIPTQSQVCGRPGQR